MFVSMIQIRDEKCPVWHARARGLTKSHSPFSCFLETLPLSHFNPFWSRGLKEDRQGRYLLRSSAPADHSVSPPSQNGWWTCPWLVRARDLSWRALRCHDFRNGKYCRHWPPVCLPTAEAVLGTLLAKKWYAMCRQKFHWWSTKSANSLQKHYSSPFLFDCGEMCIPSWPGW